MKLMHLSDLHLGKRVSGYSMLEDQNYILNRILEMVQTEQPDGVLIAGDVYDKAVPPAEAVELFDRFLVSLHALNARVFLISGNHDSPERLAFGGRLMDAAGVHVAPVYDGHISPVYLEDTYGKAAIWLLPFLKPTHVRRTHPEAEITSYSDAMALVVKDMRIDPAIRNVLVTHQFITGAERCESEELSVGGSDNVDVSVFDGFDYVALGHLHGPQQVSRETVRYCGTPLKYSFSEVYHKKSVTMVELGEKGVISLRILPLTPLRELRELRGSFASITAPEQYQNTTLPEDYLRIILTDEEEVPDAIGKLQKIYHRIMKLEYDNRRTRSAGVVTAAEAVEAKSPLELFGELYEKQNNQPMSEEQQSFTQSLIQKIWEVDA